MGRGWLETALAAADALSWAGRTVTGRQAERQTITFTELVRRVEVNLPTGAVSFAPADGPARVNRTVRWLCPDR